MCRAASSATRKPPSHPPRPPPRLAMPPPTTPYVRAWPAPHSAQDGRNAVTVVMGTHVPTLPKGPQPVAGSRRAAAGCNGKLEMGADVTAGGYLREQLLAGLALPRITTRLLTGVGDRRRARL